MAPYDLARDRLRAVTVLTRGGDHPPLNRVRAGIGALFPLPETPEP